MLLLMRLLSLPPRAPSQHLIISHISHATNIRTLEHLCEWQSTRNHIEVVQQHFHDYDDTKTPVPTFPTFPAATHHEIKASRALCVPWEPYHVLQSLRDHTL